MKLTRESCCVRVTHNFVMVCCSADQVASILQAADSDNKYEHLASDIHIAMEDDVVEECFGELSDESSDKSFNESGAAAGGEGIRLAQDETTIWKWHTPSASKF